MRHTCNKKAHPNLKKDCLNCSEYNPCVKGEKWCFVSVAELIKTAEDKRAAYNASAPTLNPIIAPILAPHDYRNIKIGENTTISIDLEQLKDELSKSHYPPSLMMGGA